MTRGDLARVPNGDNYRPIAAVVRQLIATRPASELERTSPSADLIEEAKHRCAELRIDYGRHSEVSFRVVHRAAASEWWKARRRLFCLPRAPHDFKTQ